MKICLLGPLRVHTGNGEERSPGGPKQRLLLALLVLHGSRAVAADRLLDWLWGEDLPADPMGALRTQVSRMRTFLDEAGAPGSALRHEPGGYRLELSGIEVDANLFEELVAGSRRAGGPAEELRRIAAALELWQGEPFEEFLHLTPFLGRARHLQELRVSAAERRVACLMALGRIDEALAAAQFLVSGDPLRERPRALLMEALYRSGRQHEALDAFQDFRRLLSEELGLDPSPGLRALESAILRHEPRPGSAGIEAEGGVTSRSPGGAFRGPRAELPDVPLSQDIRFCLSTDGVRIAYATVGSGPPLVKAANWLNHLEFDWESPVWRRLFHDLGSRNRLLRYDERGSGLSDWDPPELSLEAWVLDLEAVVDAAGLERFPLLGISQGCAVCIEFAARHPDRVTGLILHGGYAAGWRVDPTCTEAEAARRDASIQIIRHGWGEDIPAYRQMFTQTFIPGGTPEEVEWFNELERRSTSPENAARFMETFGTIDVRHRLGQVQAPALVLHSRGDRRIHFDKGRELASGIPRARFVLLESDNHLVLGHEPAFEAWMSETHRFLESELDP